MVEKKALRQAVTAVVKNNHTGCSVCVQHIDSGVLAFANMREVKISWGRDAFMCYAPHESTFKIPYMEIQEYQEFSGRRQIEITLAGRFLVSVRECQ
jgi:hypothetical protein